MSCIICYKKKDKCRCGKLKILFGFLLLSGCSTFEQYSEYRQGCEDSSRGYVSEEMLDKYCDILVTLKKNKDDQKQRRLEKEMDRK